MRLFDLRGKNVLVSGASRGIGAAIACGLADSGAAVAVAARSVEALGDLQKHISDAGGKAIVQELDVNAIGSIPDAVRQVESRLGPVDILFNVAGTNIRKPIEEITEAEFDQITVTNYKGAYFLCQEVGRGMIERRRGKVVNIGSLTTGCGVPKISAYAGSKGAIGQLTKGLAAEWGRYNIQVNAIAPGFIVTDLNRKLWDDSEMRDWVHQLTPAGRLGSPEDMVGTAIFLAAPASDFMSGQVLYVDGGIMASIMWPL